MIEIYELFANDYTLRIVALGSAILSIISGALGTYAVLRKQSLLGDAVSHAAFPGICLVFLLTGLKRTEPLLLGALIAGWLAAILIRACVNNTRIKLDSALGVTLSSFFGVGLIIITYIQKIPNSNQAGLDKFIFGQASTLLIKDIKIMTILGVVALLIVIIFWKEFKLFCFDKEFGNTMGFSIKILDILLTTTIVIAIVIGLQTVGVILMSVMLIAPAIAARQWTDRLWLMMIIASIFGALSGVTGTVISSLVRNIPTGPMIVIVISLITFISILLAPKNGLVWKIIKKPLKTDTPIDVKGGREN
ncbi:MAG: metal ABC transporter permease [Maledivibacter sp.]|jgi:manganese/zinc/iron transport system permease protein|nr:metal ABC transporter permease [Maledivibacter sp.]